MYRPVGSLKAKAGRWPTDGGQDWQFNCLQEVTMICYAVRSSFGEQRSHPGGGPVAGKAVALFMKQEPGRKIVAPVGRSAIHPRRTLLAWKCSRSKVQIRRQNGYET
jgi:hypothetical protein